MKYCSDRCKSQKPGPVDKRIEDAIVSLLNQEDNSGIEKTAARTKTVKGDKRMVITCGEIEEIVFGSRHDPKKVFGRRKNRASRAIGKGDAEWRSVDMDDSDEPTTPQQLIPVDDDGRPDTVGPNIRPPQLQSDVNGSIGGEKGWAERAEETPEEAQKRKDGQRRAEEREMVRRASRRAVIFGLVVSGPENTSDRFEARGARKAKRTKADSLVEPASEEHDHRRKCEAIMNGSVVEPSFAKGDWAIRWRE